MPTPTRYYYIIDNKQLGPNTAEDMSAAIRSGLLTGSSIIIPEGGKQWKPLSLYPDLAALLPPGSKRHTNRRVNAVPPTKPTPPADPMAKPTLPAQALGMPKPPATPQATAVPVLAVAASPAIAKILQIIAAINLFLGTIAATLCFSGDYPMSGLIGFAALISALLASVFLYAFSQLLTWVYNIMLNTSK